MPEKPPSNELGAEQITEKLRRVSPIVQIESHEWHPSEWKVSKRLLDQTEAELSLARGRLTYEEFLRSGPGGHPAPGANGSAALPLFRKAARLFRSLGDTEGEREALFWVGTLEQVINRNFRSALRALHRSQRLARAAEDRLILSCVERHLGFIELLEGRHSEAERHLEESVRLRRELGFSPGVAMGLLALAELSIERHDPEQARLLLDEAAATAQACGAMSAMEAIDQTRARMGQ